MSVITLSRETGSLGDETARLLSEQLRYKLMDRGELEKIIDGEGLPEIAADRFDEQNPSFWEHFTNGKDIYLDRLRTAVLEAASSGDVIMLGRGAQFTLESVPGVFRVRLIAGRETRISRISEKLDCDRKTAERHLRKSDHDRSGFSRFFFGAQWSDPAGYDMTLCTDRLDATAAAGMIRQIYGASPASRENGGKVLTDRLTSQIVRNRILYIRKIPVDLLEVEADGGHVTLRGTVTVRENARRCEEAAREVNGVASVETEVYFVNPVMTY